MEKMIEVPHGGIIRRLKIVYRSYPEEGRVIASLLSFVLSTKYGVLFGLVSLDSYDGAGPLFRVNFSTQGEKDRLDQIDRDFGKSFEELPRDVQWNAMAEIEYRIQKINSTPFVKLSKTSAKIYTGTGMIAGINSSESRKQTYWGEAFKEITEELIELGILRQASVLALLKHKAVLPGYGFEKDYTAKTGAFLNKALDKLIQDEDRAAILMHQDRDIRLTGASVLGRTNKVAEKKPARKAGR